VRKRRAGGREEWGKGGGEGGRGLGRRGAEGGREEVRSRSRRIRFPYDEGEAGVKGFHAERFIRRWRRVSCLTTRPSRPGGVLLWQILVVTGGSKSEERFYQILRTRRGSIRTNKEDGDDRFKMSYGKSDRNLGKARSGGGTRMTHSNTLRSGKSSIS